MDSIKNAQIKNLTVLHFEKLAIRNLVYKKYCAAPSASQGSAYKEVDTPDTLRLILSIAHAIEMIFFDALSLPWQ
jgi:hypothetical protein